MKKIYNLVAKKDNKKVSAKLFFNKKLYNFIITTMNEYDVTDYTYLNDNSIIELIHYVGSGTDITTP